MRRRAFMQVGGIAALHTVLPRVLAAGDSAAPLQLTPKPGEVNLVGPDFPATEVWGYNGQVPGVPIRLTHGQTLDALVTNGLEVPTAVHWHGIRLPNAMDGVAGLTQPPIKPGDSFRYTFTPPDAGTFWYHSHVNAYEQVGRGLYGPLIIEEAAPPKVDRELTWMIDDWRLLDDASIKNDFSNGHDRSHAGRIGNVPTVNGRFRDVIEVQTGERIRLRIINASNARNFALTFTDLEPSIIAIDGQPVTPYKPEAEIIVGAAGRVDLIIDMTGEPESLTSVIDNFYRQSFDLVKFAYQKAPLRDQAPDTSIALAQSSIPEPDLNTATTHNVVLAGGAMGGLQQAKLNGKWMDLRQIARQGYVWAMNDIVANKPTMPPLVEVKQGQSVRLVIDNQTAFPHPMHLHGHHMKLLSIDGNPVREAHWVDSPLVMPRQRIEVAFVADNPGDWLFHCHVLEHHVAGLGALVSIT